MSARELTIDEMQADLAYARSKVTTAEGYAWLLWQTRIGKLEYALESGKPFVIQHPTCQCGADLIVPGEDCPACGRPCWMAFFATDPDKKAES